MIDEETYAFDEKLARDGVLSIHKVADQYEQDDEDVEQERRLQKEVMAENQKGLYPISAPYGPNNPGSAWVPSHGASIDSSSIGFEDLRAVDDVGRGVVLKMSCLVYISSTV